MIPVQAFSFEQERSKYSEDYQSNHFLQDLELDQGERPAVALETNPVGRDLESIFEQGDSPRKQNDREQRPVGTDLHFLQLQVPVPCKSHENVRDNQHPDCRQDFWIHCINALYTNIIICTTNTIISSILVISILQILSNLPLQ